MNPGTIAVMTVLIVIIGLIVFKAISDKRKGRPSCGNNCAGCAAAGTCHGQKNSEGM